jgi:hypothetical protein
MEPTNQQIEMRMFQVGCAAQALSRYTGISKSSLSEYLAANSWPNGTAEKIQETLDVMQLLRTEAGLPIDWSQVAVIKPVLDLRIQKYREEKDPIVQPIYLVKLSGTSWFEAYRGGQIVGTPSQAKAAGFEKYDDTQRCINHLKKLEVNAAVDFFRVGRRRSTLTADLRSVGLDETGAEQ